MHPTSAKELTRGDTFVAGGICAGLARHYGWNKGGVQAAFVVGTLVFGDIPLVIYLVLWRILPKHTESAH
ncbi:PspC domain-containing protein [Neptunicella marina]|uniref:PspC domain-containing protein n=1 Tax=Neptunicella marina TaxID=2125989 RepID=A0A8J6LXL6_9ALTE|nr:PspC domain-containing protein [Neptunicella marina]MBC3765654.1 PspC domain-containing protein [Neptunicella marina]